jgi:uncharacterized damage-inducible protein DinB
MNSLLRDLYGHQEWADAEHWRAIRASASAREDAAIRLRLLHLHLVQRFFMFACGDGKPAPEMPAPEDFPTFEALESYARASHERVREFVGAISDARLDERVTIPWFRDPALSLTVGEALTQCAMHSHYHRAQNATRLRELGGEPPGTDLIVWYWRGRPAADWGPQ